MRRLQPLVLVAVLFGCKEYVDAPLSPAEAKRVENALVSARPTPEILLNAKVEDQVQLIGIDAPKAATTAGEKIKLRFYLEALSAEMEDNQIFIHFQCRGPGGFHNLDGRSVTQRLHPLRKLSKGQFLVDDITFTVKSSCRTGSASLYWGLFRGGDRLKVTLAEQRKVMSDGRLLVTKLKVIGKSKPILKAKEVDNAPTIDGQLNDVAWRSSDPVKLKIIGGRADRFQNTEIHAAYDQDALYLGIKGDDSDVWSDFQKRDSNTWEQEVVEVFIDALGKKKDYVELQLTPRNIIFDAMFTHHRSDLSVARKWTLSGLETAVHVDGTVDARDDQDRGFQMELKIPIDSIPHGRAGFTRKTWQINFFRFDKAKDGAQQASGWSPPPVPDFHHLDSFGTLKFVPLASRSKTVSP